MMQHKFIVVVIISLYHTTVHGQFTCQCTTENEILKLKNDIMRLKIKQTQDCSNVPYNPGKIYAKIHPLGVSKGVVCQMDTTGHWTVIQQRFTNGENFDRTWKEYEEGFGSFVSNHWIGLATLYRLTIRGRYTLKIELEDQQGNKETVTYDNFKVGPASDNYRLHISGFKGDIGDSFAMANNQQFSTKDKDNDLNSEPGYSCASNEQGGWWHNSCFHANLNGQYSASLSTRWGGIHWEGWTTQPLMSSVMKIQLMDSLDVNDELLNF